MTPEERNIQFTKDLGPAKVLERLTAFKLYALDPKDIDVIKGRNDNKWDLEIIYKTGNHRTIEIKEDKVCFTTGNVAIEFENDGEPSGIAVTKADDWLLKVHTEVKGKVVYKYYLITVKALKDEIARETFFKRQSGGDNGLSWMYLFKLDYFRTVSSDRTQLLTEIPMVTDEKVYDEGLEGNQIVSMNERIEDCMILHEDKMPAKEIADAISKNLSWVELTINYFK